MHDILRKYDTFGNLTLYSYRNEVTAEENHMAVRDNSGVSYTIRKPLAYNEFLKCVCEQTSIPI